MIKIQHISRFKNLVIPCSCSCLKGYSFILGTTVFHLVWVPSSLAQAIVIKAGEYFSSPNSDIVIQAYKID